MPAAIENGHTMLRCDAIQEMIAELSSTHANSYDSYGSGWRAALNAVREAVSEAAERESETTNRLRASDLLTYSHPPVSDDE